METASAGVELTETEMLCLEAVRAGFAGKTAIAIQAKRGLTAVDRALGALSRDDLVRRQSPTEWRTTPQGQMCQVHIISDQPRDRRGRKPGKIVAGSAGERLLNLLDRPRRGQEVLTHLGVTRQRLHQLVVRFYAEERLRLGDPECITHILARADDRSVLLTRAEERLLSAIPEGVATTVPRLAAATRMDSRRTSAIASSLLEKDLIAACGEHRGHALFRHTPEGQDHFQRRAVARVTEPVPLEVRSDRVHAVLACLAEHRQARTRDLGEMVGVPLRSMNALMQYLKRKGMVEKTGDALVAPYMLAPKGQETLEEMARRRTL